MGKEMLNLKKERNVTKSKITLKDIDVALGDKRPADVCNLILGNRIRYIVFTILH